MTKFEELMDTISKKNRVYNIHDMIGNETKQLELAESETSKTPTSIMWRRRYRRSISLQIGQTRISMN